MAGAGVHSVQRLCVSSIGAGSHLSKVEDETVAFVEAAPGQCHLLGTDVALPFDLIQPVHRAGGLRPPESRLNTTLLWHRPGTCLKTFQAVYFNDK